MEFYTLLIYLLSYIGLFAVSYYIISTYFYYKNQKKPIGEKEDKTVTILIPAFNEEKSIGKTIESALASNYPKEKLEIIVIDDGSSDKTYEIAKEYTKSKEFKVRVLKKKNGGKATALNLGIKKAKHEIVISMDADTFIRPDTVRKMIGHFYNKRVMSSTPSMIIHEPKGILQRVQQIEYYLGIFLRKAFAISNAIHITPGAFAAYRKEFFEKYGGYDVGNITEDLEVALRIQSHDYIIENVPEAVVSTIAPRTFKNLMIQRRRWYAGMIKNFMRYKSLFSGRKGVLGLIVLPIAVITVILSVVLTVFMVIKTLGDIASDLALLSSINFEFSSMFEATGYFLMSSLENFAYNFMSNPVSLFGFAFLVILVFYMQFAKKKVRFKESYRFSLFFFVILYSVLFSFWWILSTIYVLFNKEISWGEGLK